MPAALTTLVTINVFFAAPEVLIVLLLFAPAGVDTLGEAVERRAISFDLKQSRRFQN